MADLNSVLSFLGGITITGVGVAWKVAPIVRRFSHFVDDVLGEEARPGVPAKPGLVERVASIEGDMESLKSGQVERARVQDDQASAMLALAASVEQIRARLDGGPPDVPHQRAAS